MGERRGAYRVLVGKPEGRRLPRRPTQRNESSRSGMGTMDLIDLAQDRDKWRVLVSAAMSLLVP
jgi:hypothetical protein